MSNVVNLGEFRHKKKQKECILAANKLGFYDFKPLLVIEIKYEIEEISKD